MEIMDILFYEAPSIEVFEVVQKSAVCASGGTEQFRNGGSYDDVFFN